MLFGLKSICSMPIRRHSDRNQILRRALYYSHKSVVLSRDVSPTSDPPPSVNRPRLGPVEPIPNVGPSEKCLEYCSTPLTFDKHEAANGYFHLSYRVWN